jgi:hypothetical protein
MKTNIKNADGTTGVLIWVGNTFMFRVYNPDLTFTDYDIRHYDLQVTIDDGDAYLYQNDKGENYLDYSNKTLGTQ